jgi:hypothetical protein
MRDERPSQPGSTIVPILESTRGSALGHAIVSAATIPVTAGPSPVPESSALTLGVPSSPGVVPDPICNARELAAVFSLKQMVPIEWIGLAREGIKRFDRNAELYIRPMYWAETGRSAVRHDPNRPAGACVSRGVLPKPTGGDHAVALSASDRGDCAGRGQGRLPHPNNAPR